MVHGRPYINKADGVRHRLARADVREASNRGTNGQQPREFRRLCARQLQLTTCAQSVIRVVCISPIALSISVYRRFGEEASINSSEADQARFPSRGPDPSWPRVHRVFSVRSVQLALFGNRYPPHFRPSPQSTHAMVLNVRRTA